MNYSREDLKSTLMRNVVEVNFIKTDGSHRKMRCTLKPDMLPEVEVKKTGVERPVNESVLPVYDLDAKGWRSFRVDSVTSIKVDQYEMDV